MTAFQIYSTLTYLVATFIKYECDLRILLLPGSWDNMWESIKAFFRRHRRKLFITGAIVGGVYLLGRYARWRLAEWQREREMEYVEQARKQHHFESNLRTCTVTFFSLVPSLRDALMEKLDCEAITAKLREKPANKLELWEQLKILSFTRTLSSIYSSCLLFVFLRVQLNIVGGYLYLDSLILTGEVSNGKKVHIAEGLQKRYLALVRYLLGDGLDFLVEEIRRSVEGNDLRQKNEKLSEIRFVRLILPNINIIAMREVKHPSLPPPPARYFKVSVLSFSLYTPT